MNVQQMLENMLSFSMQQHAAKDATIAGLQKMIADLEKQLAELKPKSEQSAA